MEKRVRDSIPGTAAVRRTPGCELHPADLDDRLRGRPKVPEHAQLRAGLGVPNDRAALCCGKRAAGQGRGRGNVNEVSRCYRRKVITSASSMATYVVSDIFVGYKRQEGIEGGPPGGVEGLSAPLGLRSRCRL